MYRKRNTMSHKEGSVLSMAQSLLPLLICLIIFPAASYARDISFSWTANAETVDGYKIYYKTVSSGAPYNGTGASEGSSPISLGKVTTVTLHGLSDTATYYFTLTAYAGSVESGYCTEVVVKPGTGSVTLVAPTIISITPH